MKNMDLRQEFRVANVRQWEVADAMNVSEMTLVKWLRKELPEQKRALIREAIRKVTRARTAGQLN